MTASEFEIVVTRGGAHAVRDRATGEVMHPVIGPSVEAQTLYVEASGLARRLAVRSPGNAEGPLVLFDVGLGAGSNAIAAFRVSEGRSEDQGRGGQLSIVSFDRTSDAMLLALDSTHADSFGFDESTTAAARALLASGAFETSKTRWRLVLGELPGSLAAEESGVVDVVYWDPFSPKANPELWNVAAFTALRRVCRAGATVHTYSCATAVRSALLLAGFEVGVGIGTGEKENTTVASVPGAPSAVLARPLDRRWLDRLARSSAPFPSDAPGDAYDRVAALPQFRVEPER